MDWSSSPVIKQIMLNTELLFLKFSFDLFLNIKPLRHYPEVRNICQLVLKYENKDSFDI